MLRDLSTVIEDLHRGMESAAERAGPGVRIFQAEMTLPVDTALVLKDGGCALLADVARSLADALWQESPSRLTLVWGEVPTSELPWHDPSPQPSPQRGEGAAFLPLPLAGEGRGEGRGAQP